jgi:hypothetical protein
MTGQPVVGPDGTWDQGRYEQLRGAILEKADRIATELEQIVTQDAVDALLDECRVGVASDLQPYEWRHSYPGKQIWRTYAKAHSLGKEPAFENALIRALSENPDRIADELRGLVVAIRTQPQLALS